MSKTIRLDFESVADMVAMHRQPIPHEENNRRWQGLMNPGERYSRPEWYGVKSMDELEAALTTGWPQGVKRMEDALGKIKADLQPVSIRRRKKWADHGDELDMQRVYAGDLAHAWQATYKAKKAGATQHITLLANFAAGMEFTPDMLFWRGAALLHLADLLTEAGYNVEIIGQGRAVDIDQAHTKNIDITVKLKAADQPLNKADLATVMCLIGFNRRVAFRVRHVVLTSKIDRNLGTPIYDPLPEYASRDDVITAPKDIRSQHEAERWLNEVLKPFSD